MVPRQTALPMAQQKALMPLQTTMMPLQTTEH
jgi:hypothetical protein